MTYRMTKSILWAGLALVSVICPLMAQTTYVPLEPGIGSDAPISYHRNRHHRSVDGADVGHVTMGYGETIISGRTGQHRSIVTGVMVPDTEPPDFVLTGRATGSGPGANGFPGSNQ